MPVKIDYKKCSSCKKCYDVCPQDVFTWDEKINRPIATYETECWHCGICFMDCPRRAIDVTLPVGLW